MFRVLLHTAICLVFSASSLSAEWVKLSTSSANYGIGYVFRADDSCRVLVPRHVYNDTQDVRITRRHKEYKLRLTGTISDKYDIALFYFPGEAPTCNRRWDHVPSNAYESIISRAISGELEASMKTVIEGELTSVEATVREMSSDHIEFSVRGSLFEKTTAQGLSGSGLIIKFFGKDHLVGIVTDFSSDKKRFVALRTEIIPQATSLTVDLPVDGPGDGPPDLAQPVGGLIVGSQGQIFPHLVNSCDLLAANPGDPMKHPSALGVPFDQMNLDDALEACREESSRVGDRSARLLYQLGRVMHAQLERDIAGGSKSTPLSVARVQAQLTGALAQGHDQAIYNLRNLLLERKDICTDRSRCIRAYQSLLEHLAERQSSFVKFELAKLFAYHAEEKTSCAPHATCVDKAISLFEELANTDRERFAAAHIGYLITQGRAPRDCQNDPDCLNFLSRAFEKGKSEGLIWSQRLLGKLYLDEWQTTRFCPEPEICLSKGLENLNEAAKADDFEAFEILGDFYAYSRYRNRLNCQEELGHSCSAEALIYYQRALDEGRDQVRRNIAAIKLFRPNEVGCVDDPHECAVDAARLLEHDSLDDNWATSLRADGMERDPVAFAAFCADKGCPQAAFDAHLQAAQTLTYNQQRASSIIMSNIWVYSGSVLDCGVGLSTEAACIELALSLAKKAFENGRSSAFTVYSDIVTWLVQSKFSEAVEHLDPNSIVTVAQGPELYARELNCANGSEECAAIVEGWLSGLEIELERQGVVEYHNVVYPLAYLAGDIKREEESESWDRLRARARTLMLKNIAALSANSDTQDHVLRMVWNGLSISCLSESCQSVFFEAANDQPFRSKKLLLAEFVKARIRTNCSSTADFCGPITDEQLMGLLSEETFGPLFADLGSFEYAKFASGPFADWIELNLERENRWEYSAHRATARLWDKTGAQQGASYSTADFVSIFNPVAMLIASRGNKWDILATIPAAIVALSHIPYRVVDSRTKGDFYLAVNALEFQKTEKTSIQLWSDLGGAALPNDVVRDIQRVLGITVDGVIGEETEGAIKRYIAACESEACHDERARKASEAVLEKLSDG